MFENWMRSHHVHVYVHNPNIMLIFNYKIEIGFDKSQKLLMWKKKHLLTD